MNNVFCIREGKRKEYYKTLFKVGDMNEICYKQIGLIHSPYKEPSGTPIQPSARAFNAVFQSKKISFIKCDVLSWTQESSWA